MLNAEVKNFFFQLVTSKESLDNINLQIEAYF